LQEQIPMLMYEFFARSFNPMEKIMMMVLSICLFLHFMMPSIRMKREFMRAHPICIFEEFKATFCKHYRKVQMDKQVYMTLQMIKQGKDKKVEVYYERILKLTNCL
jgi:hypothetical protein